MQLTEALAKIEALTKALETANTAKAEAESQLTAATEQVTLLTTKKNLAEAKMVEFGDKLTAAETEAKNLKAANADLTQKMSDFDRRVASRLVELGVRSQAVQGSAASEPTTLDEVRAALSTTTDPVEKSKLARKARELRGHGDCFKN